MGGHLRSDRERKAMFANMGNPNNRGINSNQKVMNPDNNNQDSNGNLIKRFRRFRFRREEQKEESRKVQEEKELKEISVLEKQAEQTEAKESREAKIAQLKEERIESRRKTSERLIMLRREKFKRSTTGRLLAASRKVVKTIQKRSAQKPKVRGRKKPTAQFGFI